MITEICPNSQHLSISLGYGMVPNKRQAITWSIISLRSSDACMRQ